MNLNELARDLEARQAERRRKLHEAPWHPTATGASQLGYRCERRIVYQRLEPTKAQAPNAELASIFEEGDKHETDVMHELELLGVVVTDRNTSFEDKRLDLKGNIDARLIFGGDFGHRRIPAEVKSVHNDGPSTQAEWANEDGFFARWYAQLTTYMYLTSSPDGIGIFKNKGTGLWTVCPIELDYEYAETLLKRAERVRDAVKLGVLPDRIPDRSECNGCQFYLTCLPADAPIDPMLLIDDIELIRQLEVRALSKPVADHFKKLDERIKARFKLTGGDRFIAGPFLVTKKTNSIGAVTVTIERSRQVEAEFAP